MINNYNKDSLIGRVIKMNIREINKPLTAKALNESLAKRFGERIALEKFTVEQLQDVRNKLRTTLSQVETTESFDSVNSNDAYQKNRLFLDVLNAEIAERIDVAEAKPDYIDLDKDGDTEEPMKKAAKDAKKDKKKVDEGAGVKAVCKDCGDEFGKPTTDCKNNCNDPTLECWVRESEYKKMDEGMKKVPSKDSAGNLMPYRAPSSGKCAPGYVLEKSKSGMTCVPKDQPVGKPSYKRESIVREGAEDQAELVMAAKNMVDKVTSWMEDTAEMQTESMLELADAIRDEKSQADSDAFVNTVKPALESLYGAMESTREALTQGVGQLTGEAEPMDAMGAEEPVDDMAADMEPTVDAEDDFAASEPAAGGEEEAGREKRESVQRKRKMLESSRRLGTIFSKKKP
jgi:hypothetical protein